MFYSLTIPPSLSFFLFFFNDTATTEIYTLSLHDALPIFMGIGSWPRPRWMLQAMHEHVEGRLGEDEFQATLRHAHRSEEHTSELQSPDHLVCRLLLEKKKKKT